MILLIKIIIYLKKKKKLSGIIQLKYMSDLGFHQHQSDLHIAMDN
jgi:hypothetical protein